MEIFTSTETMVVDLVSVVSELDAHLEIILLKNLAIMARDYSFHVWHTGGFLLQNFSEMSVY